MRPSAWASRWGSAWRAPLDGQVGRGWGRGWVWVEGPPCGGCTATCPRACELSSPPVGWGHSALRWLEGPLPAAHSLMWASWATAHPAELPPAPAPCGCPPGGPMLWSPGGCSPKMARITVGRSCGLPRGQRGGMWEPPGSGPLPRALLPAPTPPCPLPPHTRFLHCWAVGGETRLLCIPPARPRPGHCVGQPRPGPAPERAPPGRLGVPSFSWPQGLETLFLPVCSTAVGEGAPARTRQRTMGRRSALSPAACNTRGQRPLTHHCPVLGSPDASVLWLPGGCAARGPGTGPLLPLAWMPQRLRPPCSGAPTLTDGVRSA